MTCLSLWTLQPAFIKNVRSEKGRTLIFVSGLFCEQLNEIGIVATQDS